MTIANSTTTKVAITAASCGDLENGAVRKREKEVRERPVRTLMIRMMSGLEREKMLRYQITAVIIQAGK